MVVLDLLSPFYPKSIRIKATLISSDITLILAQALKEFVREIKKYSTGRKCEKIKNNSNSPIKSPMAKVPTLPGSLPVFVNFALYIHVTDAAVHWPLWPRAIHASLTTEASERLQPSRGCTAGHRCRIIDRKQRRPPEHRYQSDGGIY